MSEASNVADHRYDEATRTVYVTSTEGVSTPVQMEDVSGSSTVMQRGYNPSTRTGYVIFKSGGLYAVHDVSPQKWEAFQRAPSAGGFFHAHLKFMHTVEKVG